MIRLRRQEIRYTLEELAHPFDCRHKIGIVYSHSVVGVEWDPHSLPFTVLSKDQYPDWPPRIVDKSNLNLLPQLPNASHSTNESDEGVNKSPPYDAPHPLSGCPIPIFTETSTAHLAGPDTPPERYFALNAYYNIKSTTYLASQSAELIAMLEIKFMEKKRGIDWWKETLEMTWRGRLWS